ncbi:hypothetical protein OYT13_15910 [Pandoraea sp. XJJ-1]|uniref:hypothetical protein n=1 Tax=Pandoraea sp. XJJ-1 TaxID=3002643 RepID=UPI0022830338|nr:hypothetical protein [Pandoraea sp. XJJ-1]WAL81337.1 hypothetical protein OYT13_15910 [Pandoraea sp. XJJ-1]
MTQNSYPINDDPFNLVAAVLHAICDSLPADTRLHIAASLQDKAARMNEDAENAEQQRFALDLATLAELAREGPESASGMLDAGMPR